MKVCRDSLFKNIIILVVIKIEGWGLDPKYRDDWKLQHLTPIFQLDQPVLKFFQLGLGKAAGDERR